MTQLIENKQSASFLIDTNFPILRPMPSQFEGKAPRPIGYHAPTTNRHLRCPCATIARGAKMESSGTLMQDGVRHNL